MVQDWVIGISHLFVLFAYLSHLSSTSFLPVTGHRMVAEEAVDSGSYVIGSLWLD